MHRAFLEILPHLVKSVIFAKFSEGKGVGAGGRGLRNIMVVEQQFPHLLLW